MKRGGAMTDQQRKWVLIGGAGLIVVLLCAIFFVLGTIIGQNNERRLQTQSQVASVENILITPTPVRIYLPIIRNGDIAPTNTITPTPKKYGDIWIVVKNENNALHQNGFVYDIDTFENKDDRNISLRAHCAEPGWPAPKMGAEYRLNKYGVLIPLKEDKLNPLQRFIVLDK